MGRQGTAWMPIFRRSVKQIPQKLESDQRIAKNKEDEIRRWITIEKIITGFKWRQRATNLKHQSSETKEEENRQPEKHLNGAAVSKITKPKDDTLRSLR